MGYDISRQMLWIYNTPDIALYQVNWNDEVKNLARRARFLTNE